MFWKDKRALLGCIAGHQIWFLNKLSPHAPYLGIWSVLIHVIYLKGIHPSLEIYAGVDRNHHIGDVQLLDECCWSIADEDIFIRESHTRVLTFASGKGVSNSNVLNARHTCNACRAVFYTPTSEDFADHVQDWLHAQVAKTAHKPTVLTSHYIKHERSNVLMNSCILSASTTTTTSTNKLGLQNLPRCSDMQYK